MERLPKVATAGHFRNLPIPNQLIHFVGYLFRLHALNGCKEIPDLLLVAVEYRLECCDERFLLILIAFQQQKCGIDFVEILAVDTLIIEPRSQFLMVRIVTKRGMRHCSKPAPQSGKKSRKVVPLTDVILEALEQAVLLLCNSLQQLQLSIEHTQLPMFASTMEIALSQDQFIAKLLQPTLLIFGQFQLHSSPEFLQDAVAPAIVLTAQRKAREGHVGFRQLQPIGSILGLEVRAAKQRCNNLQSALCLRKGQDNPFRQRAFGQHPFELLQRERKFLHLGYFHEEGHMPVVPAHARLEHAIGCFQERMQFPATLVFDEADFAHLSRIDCNRINILYIVGLGHQQHGRAILQLAEESLRRLSPLFRGALIH